MIVAALVSGAPMGSHVAELTTVVNLNDDYPGDPGVLISLLLNRISLAPGEAVYLPAGNVHAYLHGLGIEVMASSDNVLRGGLTPKFVDVPELLKTVAFEAVAVPMLAAGDHDAGPGTLPAAVPGVPAAADRAGARRRNRSRWHSRAPPSSSSWPAPSCLDSPKGELRLDRGASAFLPAAEAPVNVHAVSGATGTALAFAVTTALEA